jgi:hypothetical protein
MLPRRVSISSSLNGLQMGAHQVIGDKEPCPRWRARACWPAAACLFLIAVALPGTHAARAEKSAAIPVNPAAPPAMPDAYRLNLLIRTTLIALNQANMTGNYTVLRDLAAPSFQRANSAARLGEIFSALRKRNLDLSPVMFFEPKLIRPPHFNDAGMLRLSGFIPSEPERVLFDLLFQSVEGRWLLFGISVDVSPPPAPNAAAAKAPPSPQKKSAKAENGSNPKNKK